MGSCTLLRYIELKTGHSDDGPAWIAHVRPSKTGSQLYFNGKALLYTQRGLYMDVETHEIYWVSGVKKNGRDRHWAGGGMVAIERDAVPDYLRTIGAQKLDHNAVSVIDNLPQTDIGHFHDRANRSRRHVALCLPFEAFR